MRKISLLDVTNGLKRDEMRFIFGGSSYNTANSGINTSGGCGYNNGSYSGGYQCQSECANDSDCNCKPCPNGWGGFQKCQTIICPGSSTQSKKSCRC